MPAVSEPKEWYDAGLKFTCTQCGNCCTGGPGVVWFNEDELRAMAAYLKLSPEQFLRRHAHTVNGRWTLNERLTTYGYDCVFLARDPDGKALCTVYPVRPTQCKTWPFWTGNLRREGDWERAAEKCPGINKGRFYPIEQIRIIRDGNPPD